MNARRQDDMIELDKIYKEDCLEGMRRIPDGSVDAIICDLPYGTTCCKWDSVIPFEPLWEQYERITKNNAPIILFGSQPFTSQLVTSNIKCFREELIWVKNKSASGLSSANRHLKIHEDIIVFSYSSYYTYNPIKWEVADDFVIRRRTLEIAEETNNIIGIKVRSRVRKVDDGSRFPISILPFKVPYSAKKSSKRKEGDFRVHPTQKPVELIRYLIRTYSNPGNTILDNCIGSGTTAIAAMREGRHFIGFELNEEYFGKAVERIERERGDGCRDAAADGTMKDNI